MAVEEAFGNLTQSCGSDSCSDQPCYMFFAKFGRFVGFADAASAVEWEGQPFFCWSVMNLVRSGLYNDEWSVLLLTTEIDSYAIIVPMSVLTVS